MCWIRWIFWPQSQSTTQLVQSFNTIAARWPDDHEYQLVWDSIMWFHRLAIMDFSSCGKQPFVLETDSHSIMRSCNGEIYNHLQLEQEYQLSDQLTSHSDCECIGYLYIQLWFTEAVRQLDGEFAITLIVTDRTTQEQTLYLARDRYWVRPLFIGTNADGWLWRSSEAKALIDLYDVVKPFVPWHIYDSTSQCFIWYKAQSLDMIPRSITDESQALLTVRQTVYDAIAKRLVADRPLACLLSWGLDSSLICGIAAQLSDQPIYTFTIWLEWGTDIKYAEMVAEHIGSIHQTFIVTVEEALAVIDQVIYSTETWDTTTIRASVWQYLIGKYISQTKVKVILTGEWSDEMSGGYLYFHNAPDPISFDTECRRLLDDVYLYDGLRVDRAMSGHGLEVRVPLLDPAVVETYLSIDPALRIPTSERMEKYLLRQAFAEDNIIPDKVLRRRKEAFSDGVSQQTKSWFELIQEHIDTIVSDHEYEQYLTNLEVTSWVMSDILLLDSSNNYPKTKEQYYYRKKFVEYFWEQHVNMIPYYRLPKWSGNVIEASARVLQTYQQ